MGHPDRAHRSKKLRWNRNPLNDLKEFPDAVKKRAGFLLREVQDGGTVNDSEDIPTVGKGVWELKIKIGGAFRIFYGAKFEEAVYVLHCFQKKSTKGIETPLPEIRIGQKRYRDLVELRKQQNLD